MPGRQPPPASTAAASDTIQREVSGRGVAVEVNMNHLSVSEGSAQPAIMTSGASSSLSHDLPEIVKHLCDSYRRTEVIKPNAKHAR